MVRHRALVPTRVPVLWVVLSGEADGDVAVLTGVHNLDLVVMTPEDYLSLLVTGHFKSFARC